MKKSSLLFIFFAALFAAFYFERKLSHKPASKVEPVVSQRETEPENTPENTIAETPVVTEATGERKPASVETKPSTPSTAEKVTQVLQDWKLATTSYYGPDRPDKIEAAIQQLKQLGDAAIPIIEQKIDTLSLLYEHERAGMMYLLGELGKNTHERNYIQAILDDYLTKDPQPLSEKESQKADLKYGLVTRGSDGKLYQDYTLTKLSAIQALESIGDETAKNGITRVIEDPQSDPLIRQYATMSLRRMAPEQFEEIPKNDTIQK